MAGALLAVPDKNYKKGFVMNGLSRSRNCLGSVRRLSVCTLLFADPLLPVHRAEVLS
jgi:hypothetical protein